MDGSKTAAVLANAFAQAYVDVTIQLKVDTAKHYAAYFNEQSQQLRADLQAAQSGCRIFNRRRESSQPTADWMLKTRG